MPRAFFAIDKSDTVSCFFHNYGYDNKHEISDVVRYNEDELLRYHNMFATDERRLQIYQKDDNYNFEDTILKYVEFADKLMHGIHPDGNYDLIYILKDGKWYTSSFSNSPMLFNRL